MHLSYGQIYEWSFAAWCIAIAAFVLLDVRQRAFVSRVTRGLEPARRMGFVESLQRVPKTIPRLWHWYLWYLIVGAPIVFLGSAVYLVGGTWLAGRSFALAGVAFSICMMAGGIYGLRSG